MSQFNIKLEDGKSMIETFADKGYVISEDDKNRLIAIKPETEEIYHFLGVFKCTFQHLHVFMQN